MKPKIAVVTRENRTILITACLNYLEQYADITSGADVLLSIQHDKIIKPDELQRYRLALNIHNAKLPEYCGFNTIQWALANGETFYYSTMHHMIEQVDAGPIAYEEKIPIRVFDTVESIYYRSALSCIELCKRLVSDLTDGREIPRQEQAGERHYYRKHELP